MNNSDSPYGLLYLAVMMGGIALIFFIIAQANTGFDLLKSWFSRSGSKKNKELVKENKTLFSTVGNLNYQILTLKKELYASELRNQELKRRLGEKSDSIFLRELARQIEESEGQQRAFMEGFTARKISE